MSNLKIDPKKLKLNIDVYKNTWVNTYFTNCYAYSLGLDLIEDDICYNAYYVGMIGKKYYNIDDETFLSMSIEYRLYTDLEAMGITYNEIGSKDKIDDHSWNIALFLTQENHFHFLRKTNNFEWTHKMGWYENPKNTDDDNQIIHDAESCNLTEYQYIKSLNLRFK